MDDDFDYGDVPETPDVPQEPPPQPAPQPSFTSAAVGGPPRWTAADDIRYARKAAGMNTVLDDLDEGSIHPQYAAPLLQEYQQSLGSMDQQRQAAQAFQQQSATASALHASAVQQAVQVQNQQHTAASFPTTMAQHVDSDGNVHDFFQHRPGEWKQVEKPDQGEADRPVAEPAAQQQPFTQTIFNGPHRTDTTWQPGETQGTSTGDWRGMPGGQAPQQQSAADSLMTEATRRMGRNEPPQFMQGPGGRQVINPAWAHYDTQRRQIYNRLFDEQQRQTRAANVQVNTDYADSLKTHPLKDYLDSADPQAARMNAIMSDFAKLHPNDPRVTQWQSTQAAAASALAKKDPATMSLGQLATATYGPHANVQKMIETAEKEVRADARTIPPNTERPGPNGDTAVYNPTTPGGNQEGKWQDMHPESIHAEAQNRVRSRLTGMLNDARKAAQPAPPQSPVQAQTAPQPAAAAAAPQGQAPAPQAAPAAQAPVPVSADLKAKYDAINAAHGAEHAAASKRDDEPSLLRRIFSFRRSGEERIK